MKVYKAAILAVCFAAIGCVSIPYDTLHYTSSRNTSFDITRQTINSLNGNFTVYAFPIYHSKAGFSSSSDIISLEKITTEDKREQYNVKHIYWGDNWRFMESILIKIDSKLLKLEDKKPVRTSVTPPQVWLKKF